MKSNALGVAVVRLQVPELHDGHRYLLNTMQTIHSNILIVIGETEARLTPNDPLTFEMREAMLKKLYPGVRVVRLLDQPSDVVWSRALDSVIAWVDVEDGAVDALPTLYGGRDSFLKHYTGKYRTFELPPIAPVSGTEAREAVVAKDTPDFRAGMIYASKHRFPTSYQCVDVAMRGHDGRFLMGQKKRDDGKWRFIGGFVSPQDASLEAAVRREMREETGLDCGNILYIGSEQVDDFRYPKDGSDRLMTAFFLAQWMMGAGKAGDDIDAVCWMDPDEMDRFIVPEHLGLLEMLNDYLGVPHAE